MVNNMNFGEIVTLLRQRGYSEKETKENLRVFYEYNSEDFLRYDIVRKFEVDYKDDTLTKMVMVKYLFNQTIIKEIKTKEELLFELF